MKRLILFSAALLCLAAVSCQKENVPVAEESEIQFNFTINAPGGQDTKAAKKGWESGDKLNIWFDGNGAEQTEPDLILTYNGSTWVAGALRSGVQAGLKASGKLTAVYEGYNDVSAAKYTYQWYNGNEWFNPPVNSNSFTGYATAYSSPLVVYSQGQDYTYTSNTVSATLSTWRFKTSFKVLVTGLTASAENCYIQVKDESDEYADAAGAWLIYPNTNDTQVRIGSANNYGYARGVQEADGIAFYYGSFATTDKKVTFRLTIDNGATEKSYTTPTAKTIAADDTKCIGIVVDYSKFIPGALKGKFSVSNTKQVHFSPGNLQYQASTDTWRFAEHQWDYVGNAAGNTTTGDDRATQADWIDLFAWGTSGYDDPSSDHDVYYHPWDNRESQNYGPGSVSGFNISGDNLTGDLTKYDWGVYNAIGASPAGTWRTLTADEWQWLLTPKTGDPDPGTNCRTSSTVNGVENARYAKASVNGIKGLIIFPDSYTHPGGVTLPSGINTKDAAYTVNTYTAADWSAIQAAGAVFLPAAGYRYWYSGSDYRIDGNNTYGGYWTRTCGSNNGNAQAMYFSESNVNTYDDRARWTSISVRLVRDVE